MKRSINEYLKGVEFLRFMAAHGYTLQRSRADVDFVDMENTHKERHERQTEVLRQGLGLPRAGDDREAARDD